MECTVNDMLTQEINVVTHTLLQPGIRGDIRQIRLFQTSLARVIDVIGEESATAQGLKKVITTAEKLRNSPTHNLYLLKDALCNGGKGEVLAMLKVGRKHLFLFDERSTVREVEPLCVLDFYVRTQMQRRGIGKRLFDYMLQAEGVRPEQLAIDGPSPKMESFLKKNYGIDRLIRQSNNFAVSPSFFSYGENLGGSGCTTPALTPAVGRFSAPKPPSAIANVIHGGGSNSSYYHENSRCSSRVATPDVLAGSPEPECFGAATPELDESDEETKPSPERPTTLQVETAQAPLLVAAAGKDSAPALSPAGSSISRRDSQLTDRGYFDVKFYHNKLW